MNREEKIIKDKIELNKRIALFDGDINSIDNSFSQSRNCTVENLKFTESWDWLMPVYKKIKLLVEDLEGDSFMFLESKLYRDLDFLATTEVFAKQLDSIIMHYEAETEID